MRFLTNLFALSAVVACRLASTPFVMIAGVLLPTLVLASVGRAVPTSDFEPADFSVTSELVALGVDIATIDTLKGLTQRDNPGLCDAAVSLYRDLRVRGRRGAMQSRRTRVLLCFTIKWLNTDSALQCMALSTIYGSKTVYSQKQPGYNDFTSAYWSSIQSEVIPRCIFKPSAPRDVSVLVLLSRLSRCPFAFKSGGHAAFAGASSVQGGITVSFENFKNVTVSHDKKTVKIQPGNSWVDVYRALEPYEITVTGGRVARVGTGGLTLGGNGPSWSWWRDGFID